MILKPLNKYIIIKKINLLKSKIIISKNKFCTAEVVFENKKFNLKKKDKIFYKKNSEKKIFFLKKYYYIKYNNIISLIYEKNIQ
ncbi:hypothetical protein ACT2CI_00565 [Candidatus Vidania fulgoroideorum]